MTFGALHTPRQTTLGVRIVGAESEEANHEAYDQSDDRDGEHKILHRASLSADARKIHGARGNVAVRAVDQITVLESEVEGVVVLTQCRRHGGHGRLNCYRGRDTSCIVVLPALLLAPVRVAAEAAVATGLSGIATSGTGDASWPRGFARSVTHVARGALATSVEDDGGMHVACCGVERCAKNWNHVALLSIESRKVLPLPDKERPDHILCMVHCWNSRSPTNNIST